MKIELRIVKDLADKSDQSSECVNVGTSKEWSMGRARKDLGKKFRGGPDRDRLRESRNKIPYMA
jgi:hypothetical protein